MAPSVARRKPRRCARACALAVVCALVSARTFGSVGTRTDAWFGASTRDDAGARATPTRARVLTSSWIPERAENARRLCAMLERSRHATACAATNATKLERAEQAREIEGRGYVVRYEENRKIRTFWSRRDGENAWRTYANALVHPRAAYASVTADIEKHRLYQGDAIRFSAIGNLASFGILANFVSAQNGEREEPWPDVQTALRVGMEAERRDRAVREQSIVIFEDDANVDFELFERKFGTLLNSVPDDYDIISLDANPEYCRESVWRAPSSWLQRVRVRRPTNADEGVKLFRAFTTFSRTTVIVVSWKGAMQILRHLPSSLVIDMYLARLLRLNELKIYVSCDGIVRQHESEIKSITNGRKMLHWF